MSSEAREYAERDTAEPGIGETVIMKVGELEDWLASMPLPEQCGCVNPQPFDLCCGAVVLRGPRSRPTRREV